mgnify:CR=1 FL=1
MTVEELNIVISANDRKFNEALDEIIGRLDDLEDQSRHTGDTMENVFAKIKAAAATLGIGKIISDSIMAGGELEQNLGGVETVFREHADSMKKAAATAFEDMGLSESDYLANANKMGALLKGSGFDTGYASSVSRRVMQRASDVASIMGVDVKDAMEAVTGAAKGNFTMMDNLGVAMNDTALQAYAQEKGLGTLESTQQKVNAAMQMFLDKTEYAAGNYARENDTFSGSLTTAKAQLENMTADLGTQLLPTATTLVTMARDGLEVISPLVVSLGEGLNSAAQYLINMSPSAKTMLAISLGMAVAIPAVTKAEAIWKAVNAGWSKVLDVLIPKEMTRANVLKATAGWLGIVAGLLAIVASVGSTAREMEESWGKSMEDTSGSADNAADSVDKVSDSYAGLNDNAKAAKKSLADIDTLNVFDSSSSTGGVDFSATVDGANAAADAVSGVTDDISGLKDELEELDHFDLSGLADTVSTTIGDIGTGFSTMWNSIFGSGQEQYEGLLAWNESIKQLWGEGWTTFWNDVGSTIYQAFWVSENTEEHKKALEDINNFLTEIDDKVSGWFDSWTDGFGTKWSEFWQGLGFSFNETERNRFTEQSQKFSTLYDDINSALVENLKSGMDAEQALSAAKDEYLGKYRDTEAAYYFDEQDWGERLNFTYAYELQKLLKESGQLEYPDYTIPESALASVIPGASGGVSGAMKPLSAAETKQSFEIHAHLNVDGREVAESVTSFQNGENSRSNGY